MLRYAAPRALCHAFQLGLIAAAPNALSNPVYRRLLLAQILSVLGSGLTTIALGLLSVVAVVLAYRLWPNTDPQEIEHSHAAQDHAHAYGDPLHHVPEQIQSADAQKHHHPAQPHSHVFVIDDHHPIWPTKG